MHYFFVILIEKNNWKNLDVWYKISKYALKVCDNMGICYWKLKCIINKKISV